MDHEQHIALLEKKIQREKNARRAAESLLEAKSYELYLAKQIVEETLASVQEKAHLDMSLLTLKTYLESILLDFNQLFLKTSISNGLLIHLLKDLVHVDGINAVKLDIASLKGSEIDEFQAGSSQEWSKAWQEENNSHNLYQWNRDLTQVRLKIDGDNQPLGYLYFDIVISPEWKVAISKQLSLFSELISVAYHREKLLLKTIKEKQRAENSEKSTRDFVAMINHELRTPLNGLLGSADLMRDTVIDSQQDKLLNTIHQSGEMLRVIINDLLDLSKMNAGMLELVESKFDPQTVCQMINDIFSIRAEEKGLAYKTEHASAVPNCLVGDADRIKQILVNLIGNAIKFTPSGTISLRSFWDDEHWCFDIEDTGYGIPLEKQASLFDPFTQVDNSSNRQHEGTGLGLAICKKLIDEMGGKISLTSEIGNGSCFHVALPLNVVTDVAEDRQVTDAEAPDLSQLSVLVVEDIKTNQVIIKLMLAKVGITPVILDNGKEAIDYLAENTADIILIDCRMPVMDGFEATRILRSQHYTKPIIALTAGTTTTEIEACFDCGMDAIVNKPYQLQDIKTALITWSAILANQVA